MFYMKYRQESFVHMRYIQLVFVWQRQNIYVYIRYRQIILSIPDIEIWGHKSIWGPNTSRFVEIT